jgi:hypothetical protein
LQAYLVDKQGKVIASSNWQQKDSFVGRNIAYRPYFQQAAANRISTYYAIGTTGNATGFYLATGIYQGAERLGVVAIKIGLEQLEHMWGNIVSRCWCPTPTAWWCCPRCRNGNTTPPCRSALMPGWRWKKPSSTTSR